MFKTIVLLALLAALATLIYGVCAACSSCSCGGKEQSGIDDQTTYIDGTEPSVTPPADGGADAADPQQPGDEPQPTEPTQPEPQIDPLTARALDIASGMSLEEKIGLLILPRGDNMQFGDFTKLISDIHAGGAVLFKPDFAEKSADSVRSMTSQLQQAGGGHMLLCVDEEGGTVVRVSSNTQLRDSKFKSPRYIYEHGGFDAVENDTREKCRFLRDLGVNVNFAPVSDVVTDEEGFLYSRAFGVGPKETAEYVGRVVGVMKEEGFGSSIKHFPGYGNAHGDTHQGLVSSAVTEKSLWDRDLVPFIEGINKGADSVMVTHTIIECIDPERPCSLSPAAMKLLRDDLGFDGVIVTDGLDMGAITKYCGGSDPCVTAVLAGADLMCTPIDSRASYNALLAAYNDGRISAERLDQSVIRILKWKINIGLY